MQCVSTHEHSRSRAGIYPSTSSLTTSHYPTSINPPHSPTRSMTQIRQNTLAPYKKKPWPFPQSRKNCVNHTRHYTTVNIDTRDQHQYSVIVSTTTIHSAHHPADTLAHTDPRLTKHVSAINVFYHLREPITHKYLTHRYNSSQIQYATNWEIESTTNEYGSWKSPIRSGGPPRKTQRTRSTTLIHQYTPAPNWKNPHHPQSQQKSAWTTINNTR